MAKAVARTKLNVLQHLPKLEQQKKLSGLLGRRGFSSETIARVVDEVLSNGV